MASDPSPSEARACPCPSLGHHTQHSEDCPTIFEHDWPIAPLASSGDGPACELEVRLRALAESAADRFRFFAEGDPWWDEGDDETLTRAAEIVARVNTKSVEMKRRIAAIPDEVGQKGRLAGG